MTIKKCNRCGEYKPLTDFYKRTNGSQHSECKKCIIARNAKYERENKDAVRVRRRLWGAKNKEHILAKHKEWVKNNPEKHRASVYKWKENNPEKSKEINARADAKRRQNPKHKLGDAVSRGMRASLKRGAKARRKWESLVGYTSEELMSHLERLFLPGMSWENYGEWEIDHKTPLAAHNYETPDDIDFQRAWALSNLQPLWKRENRTKSDKLLKPFQPSLALAVPANDNKAPEKSKKKSA